MQTKVLMAIQIIAGVMLLVFGFNKFFHFIDMAMPAAGMGAFMSAIIATGYLFKVVALVEIAAGLAFILNRYVALMAVVLMPVMVNAFLAHAFLDPSGIGGALLLTLLTIVIMIGHKDRYRAILES